jgi:hypothetical protein
MDFSDIFLDKYFPVKIAIIDIKNIAQMAPANTYM